jgi:hypothetical protein
MTKDVIVDEVRRVREELIKRYGGLDGWIQHLQEMDRQRARKVKNPSPKRKAAVAKKKPKRTTKARNSRVVK